MINAIMTIFFQTFNYVIDEMKSMYIQNNVSLYSFLLWLAMMLIIVGFVRHSINKTGG